MQHMCVGIQCTVWRNGVGSLHLLMSLCLPYCIMRSVELSPRIYIVRQKHGVSLHQVFKLFQTWIRTPQLPACSSNPISQTASLPILFRTQKDNHRSASFVDANLTINRDDQTVYSPSRDAVASQMRCPA